MNKVTLQTIHEMKQQGKPIAMLTAYDYSTALVADQSNIEVVLVGDSLGMVVHGFETTLPVTMEMMILHCQAVRRGLKRAFLIGDLPFMSYQTSLRDAKRNAGRLLAEGGVDGVKLEGGQPVARTVQALVESGVAVMGHIGLTPQSVSAFGGFRTQGKTLEAARRLIEDADAIEAAGAFSLVLEGIPAKLAGLITQRVKIPTIGIGAGSHCDGQVLVMHDLVGMFERVPKFVKKYANLSEVMRGAFEAFGNDVRNHTFPAHEHEYTLSDEVWETIEAEFGN